MDTNGTGKYPLISGNDKQDDKLHVRQVVEVHHILHHIAIPCLSRQMSTVDPSRTSERFGEIATSQPSGLAAVFPMGEITLYPCRLAYMQCRKQCVNQFVIGNHLLSRATVRASTCSFAKCMDQAVG